MTEIDQPICVVHILADGDIRYFLSSIEVGLVDEGVPNDRVHQITLQTPREEIAVLVGSSPTGRRHVPVEHRILRWLGRSHRAAIDDDA
jgi:hypothetical protein